MNRRKALKSLGLASVLGTAGLAAACANIQTADSEKKSKVDTTAKETKTSLTERDKLIVNRKKMTFNDPENPTAFEHKHTPDIKVGEKNAKGHTRVDVLIGQKDIIHPTEANHWIDYIQLWQNGKLIGKVEFEIGVAGGFASFYIELKTGDKITAEAGCNLHGIWTSFIEV